jgi:hypothetical protein
MSPVRKIGDKGYGPVGGAPDVVKAARDLMVKCGQWPYPWSYPPPGSEALSMRGTIALPAQGVQTQVCSFNVPVGKLGYLDSLMLSIVDGNYVEGLGFATWAVLVNQPAGATFAIGRPAQGYGNITTQFGSIADGPIKLPYGVLLGSDDTLYIHITIPAAPVSGGANPLNVGYPSTTTCWGLGWIWPAA